MDKLPGKLSNDFAELVHRGVESDVLDYKAVLCWTKMTRQAKGKIVRHCLALANTKGGCIVIGVGEDASGHPSVYMGLSREEVHSFDPTTVGQFVNRYVEPPIEFTMSARSSTAGGMRSSWCARSGRCRMSARAASKASFRPAFSISARRMHRAGLPTGRSRCRC